MNVASLFSGIGGFEIGLGDRFKPLFLNEIDECARSVLREHFADTIVFPDITELDAEAVAGIPMLVGGFPCQDVSIVGGQRGLSGQKTALVKHVFRIVEKARPDWLLLENVQSVRFVHGGRVLEYLIAECERLGYAWAYRILDSAGFGLAQRRRRFYFLASLVDDPGKALFADVGRPRKKPALTLDKPLGFYWTEGRAGNGLTLDAIPTLKAGSTIGIPSPPAVLFPDGEVVIPTIETAERLQGFPSGWTAASPRRDRWRLVGNAVSPPVLAWIGQSLIDNINWNALTSDFPAKAIWPIAGWGDGKGIRRTVHVEEFPTSGVTCGLAHADYSWTPLSPRALSGFLSRAKSSSLRYPQGFILRLDQALANSLG
ncbi:DNA cytosine methyltransferase [Rhizobium ruizarguesonis]|uniref:DNA cytosine methyltransferase n=1 Tax=Rhizobium ruizarguesonis TaxID=2081791 RepID=UPI00102F8CC0|nr:DNA cytosine methyltransferase [Rhizobium ruizarguesonis]TBB95934.1 DNA cytosine methyltransferase [Rhizobium ruizarguesonis]